MADENKIARAQSIAIRMAYLEKRVAQEMREVRETIGLNDFVGPSYLGLTRVADRMRGMFVQLDELQLSLLQALRDAGISKADLFRSGLAYSPSIAGEEADMQARDVPSSAPIVRSPSFFETACEIVNPGFVPALPVPAGKLVQFPSGRKAR